jgi:SAM-dependent methyltransferase
VLAVGIARLFGVGGVTLEHPSREYFSSPSYAAFLRAAGIALVGCDLRAGLPVRDASFDSIFLCDVIEHLFFTDVRTLLEEIRRVLTPAGRLVLSTPNLNRLGNVVRMLRGYSPNPPFYPEACGETWGHIREFAPRELTFLLRRHGLAVVREKYGLNPSFTGAAFGPEDIFSASQSAWINRVNRHLSRLLPRLADEIYLVAEKTDGLITTP